MTDQFIYKECIGFTEGSRKITSEGVSEYDRRRIQNNNGDG